MRVFSAEVDVNKIVYFKVSAIFFALSSYKKQTARSILIEEELTLTNVSLLMSFSWLQIKVIFLCTSRKKAAQRNQHDTFTLISMSRNKLGLSYFTKNIIQFFKNNVRLLTYQSNKMKDI